MFFPTDITFHLFANCIPVKGKLRSIIYDLQRNEFEYIPNSLYEILMKYKDCSFQDLVDEIDPIDQEEQMNILISYFEFLYDNEFIFFSRLGSVFFPDYNIDLPKPYNVSCLVIDINSIDLKRLEKIKNEVISTKTECLVFRFQVTQEHILEAVSNYFNDVPLRTIQIFIDSKSAISDTFIGAMIEHNKRISLILKYNAEASSVKQVKNATMVMTEKNIMSAYTKINTIADFDVNPDLFVESHHFNNFFNKRVYIDSDGTIFRHEQDDMAFGNVMEVSINDVIDNGKFKEFWNIRKDDMEACYECEYRYMCVDNRKPLHRNESGRWILEGHCNYNAETAKWNN